MGNRSMSAQDHLGMVEGIMMDIDRLLNDELNLCSIELIAKGGSMIIDQSLDITLRGELSAAMKAVRFLFTETRTQTGKVEWSTD